MEKQLGLHFNNFSSPPPSNTTGESTTKDTSWRLVDESLQLKLNRLSIGVNAWSTIFKQAINKKDCDYMAIQLMIHNDMKTPSIYSNNFNTIHLSNRNQP